MASFIKKIDQPFRLQTVPEGGPVDEQGRTDGQRR